MPQPKPPLRRRRTVNLPDDLEGEIEALRTSQPIPPNTSEVVRGLLRRGLDSVQRGEGSAPGSIGTGPGVSRRA